MKNATTCLNVVIDVSQGNNRLLLKVISRYVTVYAKATFNTNLSMRRHKKALDKISQLLVLGLCPENSHILQIHVKFLDYHERHLQQMTHIPSSGSQPRSP